MAAQSRKISSSYHFGGSCRALFIALGLLFLLGVAANGRLNAQITDQTQRQRLLDEPFRLRMDEQVPTAKRALFDWGGWFRSSYWAIDEHVDRDFDGHDDGYHALRFQQWRLWGNINLDQAHQFYARAMLNYYDWNHRTSYDHNDSDWEGVNLERGWYNFRLSQAQYARGETPGDFDLALKIGRQYVELGAAGQFQGKPSLLGRPVAVSRLTRSRTLFLFLCPKRSGCRLGARRSDLRL
ncbi:MAG: hypothetical protein AMJ79_14595 [Phycisphaerae bacterium SM23_30]|nr:MAG: hypothetical protein AMJ79_14595 [Phycisphaerae bacterium SM23_30]